MLYYVVCNMDRSCSHSMDRLSIPTHRRRQRGLSRQRMPSDSHSDCTDSDTDIRETSEHWAIVSNTALDPDVADDATEVDSDATLDAYENSPLKALGLIPVRSLRHKHRRHKSGDGRENRKRSRHSSGYSHHRRRDLGRAFEEQFFNISSKSRSTNKTTANNEGTEGTINLSRSCSTLCKDADLSGVNRLSKTPNRLLPSDKYLQNTVRSAKMHSSSANHSIQRILTSDTYSATSDDTSGRLSRAIESPAPAIKFEHFKKRMICSSIGGKSTDHTIANIIGLPWQRIPTASQSFSIYEDPVTNNSDTGSVTLPVSSPAKGKIGIVISHGRALLLQDRLRLTPTDDPKQRTCGSPVSNSTFRPGLTMMPPNSLASPHSLDTNRRCDVRTYGMIAMSAGKRGQIDSESENDVKTSSLVKRSRLNSSSSGLKATNSSRVTSKCYLPTERRTTKVLHVNNSTD